MVRGPLGLILDFEGVLTRTAKRDQVLRCCEEDLGLPAGKLMQVLFSHSGWHDLSTGRTSEACYWEAVCEQLGGRVPAALEPFRKCFFAYEELNRPMIAWVRRLRRRYKVALLSNATPYLDLYLVETGVGKLFDLVVNSARVGLRKPDARVYELTLSRLGLIAADCVFVDDKERNTLAAQAIGLPSLVFDSVANTRKRLKSITV